MLAPPAPDVTVSAWAGSTNLGDELVLAALLAKLAERGARPVVLSVDPAGTTATHGVEARPTGALLDPRALRPRAVVLGGGGLLQDETSPYNLPYHLGRARLAALGGRRLAGVGLGAGPVTGHVGAVLLRRALAGAVGVSVRDRGSQEVLRSLGVPSRLAADLATSLPLPEVAVSPRIGVSLRPWSGGGGSLPVAVRRRSGPAAAPAWFVPAIAEALDRAATATGLDLHLVALQGDRDGPLHDEVAARLRSPATTVRPTVATVVDELASCEVVVAMRYHAGIAALLGGRPAAVIGYSPKVPSLAAEVPGGFAGLRWDEASIGRLPAVVEGLVGAGDAVVAARERLRARERVNDEVLDLLLGDGPGGDGSPGGPVG